MKILIAASNMVHINNFHRPYIEALRAQGNQVFIMAGGEGADFCIDFKKRSLSFKNLRLSYKIRSILKKEDFDVIFLHTTLAAFWVRFALRGVKRKPCVINTVHGYLFGENCGKLHNFIYLQCEKLLRRQTDHIIVMNKEDLDIAKKHKLCKGEVVLSCGMGVSFKENVGEPKKPIDKGISLAFVGEISKRKNQIFLVKALKQLEGYSLTLVGDGDGREEIEKYVKKHGLADRVFITGFTKEAYEYIAGCDIYVSASEIEGLPFNIMEAMYLKKPIIASNIKGHSDLLPQSSLFTPNHMDELVSLVKRTEIKEVEYSIDKYRLDAVICENMKIYMDLIEKSTNGCK